MAMLPVFVPIVNLLSKFWDNVVHFIMRYQDLQGSFSKELVFWIDDCATKYYFRKLCWRWFSRNASGFYGDGSVASGNPVQHDTTINGVQIDFIQHGKDRNLYMKIWDNPESGFPKELFLKIEKATTTTRPFYGNIYFLFSIGRVCNYVEELFRQK